MDSPWAAGAVIILLAVAVYLPALHAGFIWDDDQHLTQNPAIIGPLGFKDIWTSSQAVYYPLVLTSFWILHKFVDLNPLPYHLLNVFMHAGSAVLLWRGLRQLGVRAAWLGAALWALHPVMVQSVAWVTELKNTQSCFFYLLSILFFLKADGLPERNSSYRRWHFGLSLFFFVLAITSKSATVMLPVVLVLCLWWRRNRFPWRDLPVLMPFFLISAMASAWTIWEQKFHAGAVGLEWSQTWSERWAIAGWNIWFYLSKIAWPTPLSFFYPQWKIDATNPVVYLPLVAALAGLSLLWWKRTGLLRPVFLAAAYFVVSLFPVVGFFNIYFFRFSFVSDHFQYLAAMGPLALVASGIASAGRGPFGRSGLQLESMVGAGLLFGLGTMTWRQARNYADAETLYRMSIARNPDCWPAFSNLGAVALQKRRVDEAIGYYQKALAIKPDAAEAQYSLGNAFFIKHEFAQAVPAYQAALRARPNNARAHSNLAICLASTGNTDEAIAQFREAIRSDPTYAEAHYNLGYALLQLGRRDEAVSHLTEAIRLKPNYAQAREQLRELGVTGPSL